MLLTSWLEGFFSNLSRDSKRVRQMRRRSGHRQSSRAMMVEILESRQMLSPLIALSGIEPTPLPYNGSAPVVVTSELVATSPSNFLDRTEISVFQGFQPASDRLSFSNTPNITGSYNSAGGILILSGTDSVAAYTQALDSVTFSNSGTNTAPRVISFETFGVDPVTHSTIVSNFVSRTVDQAPHVVSINRSSSIATTSANSVDFTVTFSEPVTGVTGSSFAVARTGGIVSTGISVNPVSGSVYTVTVNGIVGHGTIGLNLVDNGTIHDSSGLPLRSLSFPSSFANQVTFATGSLPEFVVTGDVNGDGIPDALVTNAASNSVSLMLGNGDGSFQPQRTFATGTSPYSAQLADVNGDGKLDIIVANSGNHSSNGTIGVLIGNGDGTFGPQQTYQAGVWPVQIAIADVNGDGNPDIVAANYKSNQLSVLLGIGNGTFQPQQLLATGLNPLGVTIGDVNGDHRPDLIVANHLSNTVSVYQGNGNGTFQSPQTYATGGNPDYIALGDVNRDGSPDLIVANESSNNVSVLLNTGYGTFSFYAPQTFGTGKYPFSVTLANMNGDSFPDLVVDNYGDGTVSVLAGHGDGTFADQQTFNVGYHPTRSTVADLNSDGKPDILVTDEGNNALGVLLANGNGNFTGQTYTETQSDPYVVSINRSPGAGSTSTANVVSFSVTFNEAVQNVTASAFSVVTTGAINTGSVSVVAHANSPLVYDVSVSGISGNGTIGLNLVDNGSIRDLAGNPLTNPNAPASFANQITFGTNPLPRQMSLTDLNGDGKADLIVTSAGNNSVSVQLGNGDGTFQAARNYATGSFPNSVVVSDVNHDGTPDLIIANSNSDSVSVLLGNGDGTFQPQIPIQTLSSPQSVAVGDFNGDGSPDLVVSNEGSNSISVLFGDGHGNLDFYTTMAVGQHPRGVAVGDFNGDGKEDIAFTNYYGNSVGILLGNGNGTFANQQTYGTGQYPTSLAMADINHDGILDLVTVNYKSDSSVSVLLGNGDGTFGSEKRISVGAGPYTVVLSDTNRDGNIDIVTSGYYSVSVLQGNGNGSFTAPSTFQTGYTPVGLAVGDINADRKPDILAANFSSNSISVLLGNGNGNFNGQTYTVNTAPVVNTQPVSTTVAPGGIVTFTATATGSPTPTIQWQQSANNGNSWADIPGATSSTYQFVSSTSVNGYQYRAVFTNAVGSASSNAATLTVPQPFQVLSTYKLTGFAGLSTGNFNLVDFQDPQALTSPTTYTATIDWGDGHTDTNLTVAHSAADGTTIHVIASHTYSAGGTYLPIITLTNAAGIYMSTTTANTSTIVVGSDLSGLISVTRSAVIKSRTTGLYYSTVTVTNISGGTILGDIDLVLLNLSSGVTLTDGNGKTSDGTNPWIRFSTTGLAAGKSLSLSLSFSLPSNLSSFNFGFKVFSVLN
jgi:FG-GAP-like repeat